MAGHREGSKKAFGLARDYYRARIVTLIEEIPADFDWRDDILFREPEATPPKRRKRYLLQLVRTESSLSRDLGEYRQMVEVEHAFAQLVEDLAELTKMQFDERYGTG